MADYVFGATSCTAYYRPKKGAGKVRLEVRYGVAYRADDPGVQARPDLFQSEPVEVLGEAPVEQATAAPGEKRSTGRTRRQTTDA